MCIPPKGTVLLMNLIKCSDHIVMNCLIDRLSIESVLFAENQQIAERFTSHAEHVPSKLNKIIVPKPGLEYYPEPNYRMYSIAIRPARYIQVNIKDRIK